MASRAVTERGPARLAYDVRSDRFELVVDVSPAPKETLSVTVSPRCIRLQIAGPAGEVERAFTPSSPQCRFASGGDATYNNGVLTVSVGQSRE